MRVLSGYMVTIVALLLAAPAAHAASVATVAKRLAHDTEQLASARDELATTRTQLTAVEREHRVLRVRIERRLVAIYQYGGTFESLTTVAASGRSVGDVSRSIDALDIVSHHEAAELERWQRLGRRQARLRKQRTMLTARVKRKTAAVERARDQLDAARAAAKRARAAAARMARVQESPLLSKVGHPETSAVLAAEGTAADAAPVEDQPIGFVESGVASLYNDSFTGQTTANGETYDPNAFTAAHPSLPFGTWVTVSGPGGSVAVRINDRGPFVGGRVIDLSRAAAQAIGLPGVGQVTLRVQA